MSSTSGVIPKETNNISATTCLRIELFEDLLAEKDKAFNSVIAYRIQFRENIATRIGSEDKQHSEFNMEVEKVREHFT